MSSSLHARKNAGLDMRTATVLTMLAIACLPVVAAAKNKACPEDPYADPTNDLCNPLRYIPSLALSVVSLTLYAIVAILLSIQMWRYGAKYMLCLVIGAYCESFGLAMRIPFRNNPHSTGIYIVEYLFVVLSPCAFLAADYILLGRIVRHLDAAKHLKPIKPEKISWMFVGSDIFTFLIQAAGGGLSTSQDAKMRDTGAKIFLAGIALQMVSFVFFTCVWGLFWYRVKKNDPELWARKGWKPLFFALGATCIGFLIRSFYRTVELSEGYTGYLNTHEVYFSALDTLPLFLSISVYVWFWPGKYLTEETRVIPAEAPVGEVEAPVVGSTATMDVLEK